MNGLLDLESLDPAALDLRRKGNKSSNLFYKELRSPGDSDACYH
jgi:hypothetical protein